MKLLPANKQEEKFMAEREEEGEYRWGQGTVFTAKIKQ